METVLSVKNMRDSDAATIAAGISGAELMMRAGKGIYETVLREHGWSGNIAIVCGSGNNAGDGYVVALLLLENGISAQNIMIMRMCDRLSSDGKYYYDKCIDNNIPSGYVDEDTSFDDYDIIVDCIYGTGFHGEPDEFTAGVIRKINDARGNEKEKKAYAISVDINSGLNGNNGLGDICVESDLTVSIGSFQPGHFLNRAKDVMIKKINCPIGIAPVDEPYYLFEMTDAKSCFGVRDNMSNKGTYGYVVLIGGSLKYSGAIRLAHLANAAMRSGAGVATVAAPSSITHDIISHVLESTIYPLADNDGEVIFDAKELEALVRNRRAIAFGMGIGRTKETASMLKYLLFNYDGILIIDADGLSDLADIGGLNSIHNENEYENEKDAYCGLHNAIKPRIVLTPHLKEFSRLTGKTVKEIEGDPIGLSRKYAKDNDVIVLLKGPTSIITDGHKVILVDSGCPGMATAGSGDVLSGIMAAVCGANPDKLLEAVASAAYINGYAGELAQKEYGSVSMIASDTISKLPEAICKVTGSVR